MPNGIVLNEKIVVFPFESHAPFTVIQSRVHEVWARSLSSTLKDDLQYTPSECFETFPFPSGVLHVDGLEPGMDQRKENHFRLVALTGNLHPNSHGLEDVGREYFDFRAALMVRNNEGLTKTYNRFHDPLERSADILTLRELHDAMDQTVLKSYGWNDLAQTAACEFLLDYEDEEDDDSAGEKKSKRKKPWRYRWPNDFRDEVIARLLELNKQRHQEELLAGNLAEKVNEKSVKPAGSKKPFRKPKTTAPDLFAQQLSPPELYVLLLLRAWEGKALTRRALNAGIILMLDDKLRTALLDNKSRAPRKPKAGEGLNPLLLELSIDQHIDVDNTGGQQIVRITATAPSTADVPQADLDRIAAVKEYFRREAENAKVNVSEETVDAEFDFVPAGY